MLGVDVLYPHQKLYGYQEHRLGRELLSVQSTALPSIHSPLMKIFFHKYRINLLSWGPAVPSLAHCISRRVQNSKSLAPPRIRIQAACKTWQIFHIVGTSLQDPDHWPIFQVQLGSFRLHGFQLDSYVLIVVQVLPKPQLSKVTTANLLPDPECFNKLVIW